MTISAQAELIGMIYQLKSEFESIYRLEPNTLYIDKHNYLTLMLFDPSMFTASTESSDVYFKGYKLRIVDTHQQHLSMGIELSSKNS